MSGQLASFVSSSICCCAAAETRLWGSLVSTVPLSPIKLASHLWIGPKPSSVA